MNAENHRGTVHKRMFYHTLQLTPQLNNELGSVRIHEGTHVQLFDEQDTHLVVLISISKGGSKWMLHLDNTDHSGDGIKSVSLDEVINVVPNVDYDMKKSDEYFTKLLHTHQSLYQKRYAATKNTNSSTSSVNLSTSSSTHSTIPFNVDVLMGKIEGVIQEQRELRASVTKLNEQVTKAFSDIQTQIITTLAEILKNK